MPRVGDLTTEEIRRINEFAGDLGRILSRADQGLAAPPNERFPDSLLLSYDGEDRNESVERRMSYYQLHRSFAAVFEADWLSSSGPGRPLDDYTVDPAKRVWARYQPVRDGKYEPGWYSIHV